MYKLVATKQAKYHKASEIPLWLKKNKNGRGEIVFSRTPQMSCVGQLPTQPVFVAVAQHLVGENPEEREDVGLARR